MRSLLVWIVLWTALFAAFVLLAAAFMRQASALASCRTYRAECQAQLDRSCPPADR